MGPHQAGEAQTADAEDLAPADAVTKTNAAAKYGKHSEFLEAGDTAWLLASLAYSGVWASERETLGTFFLDFHGPFL
jgi:hypothetical protein